MNLRIVVSPEAESDIIGMYVSGIRTFGLHQADRYETMLKLAIEQDLAEFPRIGLARPELGSGIHSLRRGAHHIYYRLEGHELWIVRILSDRMDVQPDQLNASLMKLGTISKKTSP